MKSGIDFGGGGELRESGFSGKGRRIEGEWFLFGGGRLGGGEEED